MFDRLDAAVDDVDYCTVDLERVKNALHLFLEAVYMDMDSLPKADNALLQSVCNRLSESLSVIEIAGIVLGTTIDQLRDHTARLYKLLEEQSDNPGE